MVVSVKICGIRERADARTAFDHGADYLGFVFEPTSPRYVGSPDWCPDWLDEISIPKVAVFGEFTGRVPKGFDFVQSVLWPYEPTDDFRAIRVLRPKLWSDAVVCPLRAGDSLLVDAHNEHELGGSGSLADWDLARRIVAGFSDWNVWLAGGLHCGNVLAAIDSVMPFGVDVSSGVESERGVKDAKKIAQFLDAIKKSA